MGCGDLKTMASVLWIWPAIELAGVGLCLEVFRCGPGRLKVEKTTEQACRRHRNGDLLLLGRRHGHGAWLGEARCLVAETEERGGRVADVAERRMDVAASLVPRVIQKAFVAILDLDDTL